jgi:hypothetical protein
MQNDQTVVSNFRNFIQTVNTIEQGQQLLKSFRNLKINNLDLKSSRCVWMSLILYKFKQEMTVSDELWTLSRQLIISMLKSDSALQTIITDYLRIFELWQADDLNDTFTQIAGNYYNLLQIVQSVNSTNSPDTIEHWKTHYDILIEKIRTYCKSMGVLEKLDKFVEDFDKTKYQLVKEIMTLAYWDKLEQDIKEGNLDVVFNNLSELKTTLSDIIPRNKDRTSLNEYFDIEYIKHIVQTNNFDYEYLMKLFKYVISVLKEWDSEASEEKYIQEIKLMSQLEIQDPSHLIRLVLEKMILLSVDLKNRKDIWNVILKK